MRFLERIFIQVVFLSFVVVSYGYEFAWKLSTNDILRIKGLVKQNIYTNNSFARYVEILNKASVEVKTESITEGKKYYGVEGVFYVFSKDFLEDKEFKLEEMLLSKYLLEENGQMIISKEYFMPITRDVPVFIRRNLNIGDEWFYKGKEVHKIGFREMFDVVEITFNVYYKFSEITNIDGKEIAVFDIKYGFADIFTKTKIIDYLSGSSEMKYYWDIVEGKPYYMTENYFFNAIYKNGVSVIYSGSSESSLEVVKKWKEEKKEEIISKLSEAVSNEKGVEVSTTENEINISIPDVIFDFNSYKVKKEFITILSNLASKVKGYKELDIIVEGHTDDIGNDEYNLKLSESRAKEVANILISFGIDPTRISYIGYGKTKPKVPNISESNRARNRRVEIKLIWGK